MRHELLSRGCTFAWAPRVVRAGTAAHFALRIHEQVDVVAALQGHPGRTVALDAGAEQSLFDLDLRGEVAVLVGNEGAGLSPPLLDLAHAKARISMSGKIESLNATAAAAIAMLKRVRQTSAAGADPLQRYNNIALDKALLLPLASMIIGGALRRALSKSANRGRHKTSGSWSADWQPLTRNRAGGAACVLTCCLVAYRRLA